MFFDFHVHNNNELVKEARRLGYTGVALFENGENKNNGTGNSKSYSLNQDEHFHVEEGVEIYAKNTMDLKRKIQKFKMQNHILMIHGGDLGVNRAACENPRVDILSHPYRGRRDCGINHVSARKAAENRVAIELNIRHLLKIKPQHRYKILGYYRDILKLQRKFNFPLIITSGARSQFDLHTPHDIIALTYCFGMAEDEAVKALSETPQNIMEKNKMISNIILEGVKIIE